MEVNIKMKTRKGIFLSLEGGEGVGKTEQAKLLKDLFLSEGKDVIVTREPGGAKLSEKIRHLLLNPEVEDMDAMTEVLLYAASRREHFKDVIWPALTAGKTVITDRFLDSSLVYQGMVKNANWANVYHINMAAIDNELPNYTFVLDMDPASALKRIKPLNREVNRFDLAPLSFHENVRKGYLFLAKTFPERIISINADQSQNDVLNEIYLHIKKLNIL